MTIMLLKARPLTFSVYFIYVGTQNEVRILIQNQIAPIVIVLTEYFFVKVTSLYSTSEEETPKSMGFEFKNGLNFLENFNTSIKDEQAGALLVPEEERILALKITKDKDFRSLEIKIKSKIIRE